MIADDRFVQQQFAYAERGTSQDGQFIVHAPATLRALIHRSARSAAGNAQLKSGKTVSHQDSAGSAPAVSALIPRVIRRPTLWPAFPVYCLAYLAPRLLARRKIAAGKLTVWERDETSRR